MLTLSVEESFGQKVYASSYGEEATGGGLGTGSIANPERGIDTNNLENYYARLRIFSLVAASPEAHYQLKFENDLPANTSVYIRVNATGLGGLLNLGLLLAGGQGISVQSNAVMNQQGISGTTLNSAQYTSEAIQISGQTFIKVTPQQNFNAVTTVLNVAGLTLLGLPLLSGGTIDVYYAYYECPTISNPTVTLQ